MYICKSMYSLFNLPTEEKEGKLKCTENLKCFTPQTFEVGITRSFVHLSKQRLQKCKQIAQDFTTRKQYSSFQSRSTWL